MSEKSPGPGSDKVDSASQYKSDQHRSNETQADSFEGETPELKGFIFDVGYSNKDNYVYTMEKVAEHISRDGEGGKMINVLDPNDLGWGPMAKPDPTPGPNSSFVELELWKLSLRKHEKESDLCKRLSSKSFAIMLGQCSPALCDTLETYPTYH